MPLINEGTGRMNSITARMDAVLTNKMWGFPIFLCIIFFIFYFTFVLGKYPVQWIGAFFAFLKQLSLAFIGEGIFRDMLVNGIISGVGGVAVYLPNILLLFLFIAIMEDSGYTARTALITDKWMKKAGLPGRSFIPLLMGFGCNVPAIMSTHMIENKRDRTLTILIIPFMSCSARLPVYILFISAFFPRFQAVILFSIYLFGIIIAWLTAMVFSKTLLKKPELPVSLELPPYKIPEISAILRQMWIRTYYFIRKMGGVILVASVIIWALGYFPHDPDRSGSRVDPADNNYSISEKTMIARIDPHTIAFVSDTTGLEMKGMEGRIETVRLEDSYIGRIGKWVHPVFSPLGFDWKMSVSILTGLPAKEIVISTLAVLYSSQTSGPDQAEVNKSLHMLPGTSYTTVTALSFMIFILLSFPCFGTLIAIRRETGRFAWMIFSLCYTTFVAWMISFIIYQAGTLILN